MTMVAGFITIYMLIDFFEKIDNFMEKGLPISMALKFFALNIPFILEQMAPVCILLAGVVTLGVLNHSNELIALKSCGIPLRRIISPILLAGAAVSLLLLAMSQFVLPRTMSVTNKIWIEEVQGRVPLGIYRNGRYYYRSKAGFYSFLRPDIHKDEFGRFSFSSWDENYRLQTVISAARAEWQDNSWILSRGQIQERGPSGTYTTTIFKEQQFDFPDRPADFFVPEYQSQELSLTGLFLDARRKQSRIEEIRAWTVLYGRIFYILLGLPLLLVGLPLVLIVYRKWGRDLSLAIPVSCGLAFACWGVWGTLQSLAKVGYLPPLLATSSVHLVVSAIGIYLLLREDS